MNTDVFANRHIGIKEVDLPTMLRTVSASSLEELIDETIPHDIRIKDGLKLPDPMSEHEYLEHVNALARKNKVFRSFIGLGYHSSITPSVIKRNILENPGWYTAYTPYQAEIAQGRLEALINFQTMVCDLTGMEIANASLLDESTAAAEAMTMLYDLRTRDQKKREVVKFFVSSDVLPQTLSLLETRSRPLGIELVIADHDPSALDNTYFGALLQYPGKYGKVQDLRQFCTTAESLEIKVAVSADILSLALLEAPGSFGADVVVGSTQRFGIPLGYGGPHAAYFATREAFKRQIPGRIIGVTKDADGNIAYRMALQTREQHIKRDKATSNICTAQVLLAVMAGAYAVYHGPEGIRKIAAHVHSLAVTLEKALEKMGIKQQNGNYFDTLLLEAPEKKVRAIAESYEMNFLFIGDDLTSIALNETSTLKDLKQIVEIFAQALDKPVVDITKLNREIRIPAELERQTPYLQNPVFTSYHSETELMRYLKRLERKDLALNHSMISLGSCTMKLNAASEMLPLSQGEWANIHPFVPIDQAAGYQEMLSRLEDDLSEITGFAATSLQPNSGAQGEFAGLMTIRAYHESRGEGHRNICLIPASAHGTNPASAVMAGMQVVVTKTDEDGNIDVEDLKAKVHLHSGNLAALMITYPSTHGVFESSIKIITKIIHDNGGQVYMDGANMNAQVGLTNPYVIGADVCHLNLHKTFAIPHGGGGPGVGPICVAAHLKPFLPGNPVVKTGGEQAITAISAAPWGSALACIISYGYIKMLGANGLTKATEIAILNANYIKDRLIGRFEVLYTGEKGRAAHEMIIDCRPFRQKQIEVADIAKRLMDYGFHAPTVSFPVPGTIMIEPTESESLKELDRFCEAMLAIYDEIENLDPESEDNLLKNAPHTLGMLTSDNWQLPYSRKQAAFPLEYLENNKFWPSVRRVDEAYGDRNLMCTCPPMEAYSEVD